MAGHNGGYIFVIVWTFILYLGFAGISTLSSLPIGRELGLFNESANELDESFYIEVTPEPWTFVGIWTTIYIWQAIWLLYALSTICRRNSTWHSYLYTDPKFMPIAMYVFFSLSMVASTSWLFVFGRDLVGISLGVIAFAAVTVDIALGLSLKALVKEGPQLIRLGHQREIGAVRGLVQNGMAFYATWLAVATHIALAIVLAYEAGMDQKDASTVILGMLGFWVLLWALLDNLVLDRYTRYLITPYIVLIVAFIGSVDAQMERYQERNFIITAILLGLVFFAFLFKMVAVCCRCRYDKEPIVIESNSNKV